MINILKFILLQGIIFGIGFDSAFGNGFEPKVFKMLSKSYSQEVRLANKRFSKRPSEIVYGNKHYGFFYSKDFLIEKNFTILKLVPPGYRYPISFFAKYRSKNQKITLQFLGKKKFPNPTPLAIRNLKIEHSGKPLSTPFLLVNSSLPRTQLLHMLPPKLHPDSFIHRRHRYTFLMTVNRLGEIVWAHIPLFDNALFSSYISPKPIGKGYYGIMFGKQSGYFEVVRYDGKVIRKFSSRDASKPFSMHHDFEILSTKKLFAIGNHMGKLSDFPGLRGKDRTFLSNTIIGIDLVNGTAKTLFDFLPAFNPNTTPYTTGDDNDDRKFVTWDSEKAEFDFLHVNSLEIVKEQGVLVSLRNINKMVMLDHLFKRIKWTVGSSTKDTYKIRSKIESFEHAHTPTMISDDEILLFDNGVDRKESRVSIYKLKEGIANLTFQHTPKPRLYSPNRSSVYQLKNKNILALFVNPRQNGEPFARRPNQDIILEIDPKSGQEIAKMVLHFNTLSPGYRAIPLNSIGLEEYWGDSLRSKKGISFAKKAQVKK